MIVCDFVHLHEIHVVIRDCFIFSFLTEVSILAQIIAVVLSKKKIHRGLSILQSLNDAMIKKYSFIGDIRR
jgi:hypothetical protein